MEDKYKIVNLPGQDGEKIPVAEKSLDILQINTLDTCGGAAGVAWNLFRSYHNLGYHSNMAVGYKESGHPEVIQIPMDTGLDGRAKFLLKATKKIPNTFNISVTAGRLLRMIYNPDIFKNYLSGVEDFEYPGTSRILELMDAKPDIIHCHNLHGDYFDLRELPNFCRNFPVILTLHDAWMLSGHCAHSFKCDRWKIGCGNCPNLKIYPAIRRDATASNWLRKRDIYLKSHLYVATPSKWLMDKVKESILAPSIIESKVIPNGVNLDTFKPYDQSAARDELGLNKSSRILLFAANGIRNNIWKDYVTMRLAIAKVAESLNKSDLIFIALGETARPIKIGRAKVIFIPYQKDPIAASRYFQAADIYIHASRAETFGVTITEALACGKPVVATKVGGIPEQITDGITGFLTTQNDANEMAHRIEQLLTNRDLREEMGAKAFQSAKCRFDLKMQTKAYLDWYKEILAKREIDPLTNN
jgi:glycosyltransferase involved in cell wall biosynthesis